jgi:predicted metal-dependent enzyme (double-stranded beta helix superfamily)
MSAPTKFTVEGFVQDVKEVIHASSKSAEEQQQAVKDLMAKVYAENSTDAIIEVLNAATPPGASISEMILHADDDMTLLWAQIPPRFQSAIHDHSIWANILPLLGDEKNVIFEEEKSPTSGDVVEDGDNKLTVVKEVVVHPGEILKLPADAIHCIENISEIPARSLHVYGGNFKTIDHERTLWSWKTKEKLPFSLPGVVKEGLSRMADEGNTIGLDAIAKAMPKFEPLVEQAKSSMKQQLDCTGTLAQSQ